MTAGLAASATDTASAHHFDPSLIYTPRPLSRGQRSRREVFVFQSPRNRRVVTVADADAFALALLLEFDPTVHTYVERPRQLQLTPKTRMDLTFWSQTAGGAQRFHLIVPTGQPRHRTTSSTGLSSQDELRQIGIRNGLELTLVTEPEIASSLPQAAVAYELLPLVWQSERVTLRAVIAEQVRELLQRAEHLSLLSVIGSLPHSASDIRATVAWLVHQGRVNLIDHTPGARDAVLESTNG